ncbi:LysM peptidoglycan-binding domain-containing protein [Ligilactobacillus acidipiscis]|uniref:Teichoic acid ABC transporter ATP binding protein n=1 Tax=Ligilactobacillus acidipiscis TaxID=89059 RepID=A0A0R2K615_9LACO|nr:LysM peptidoglycan-binding domain-containing protein [Ligilactobacillus acidipiscis]KRN81652.1 teichoic acid ABC transporter ATP binding protein [Ligilactobacillus acidipiscis]
MNSKKVKIKAEYLTKKFELLTTKNTKNKAKSLFGMNGQNSQDFWALRNVSFEIRNGECVGVIGLNGAGKSTLLNIISGQISQTTGKVEINGDVSIIAANAGMQKNLSGRENIRLKALMMGMTNKEIDEKMDEIINFSELGPFIDQPVKTYSSGMKAKLGFSIMVHQNPDIMIVDEALSVGDKTFVDKSRSKMFEFRDEGKTVLLVSHDMRTIKEWCDRVIWLNYGEVKAYGTPEEIIPEYNKFSKEFKKMSKREQKKYKDKNRRAQLDYSVKELETEVFEKRPTMSRKERIEVSEGLKKNKDGHRLSILSKIVVCFSLLAFMWLGLVSLSSASAIESVEHPKVFLTEKMFQEKTSFKKKRAIMDKRETSKGGASVNKSPSKQKQSTKRVTVKSSSVRARPNVKATYIVKTGDSIGSIADDNGVSVAAIQAENPGVDFNVVNPGQKIKLPATTTKKKQKSESANTKKYKNKGTTKSDKQGNKSTYTVKTGDSIGSIADHFGVSVAAIQAENPDVDFSVVNPGQTIKLPK